MPNSMAEVSECGGDEEVRGEGNNESGIRSRDEGGDDCESNNTNSDSTVGLNEGEGERLPLGSRNPLPTKYNSRGSSSEAVFANLGPNTKDTELRLGLPQTKHDVPGSSKGCKASNPGGRLLPDPAYFDGILQGGRFKYNFSRTELSDLVPNPIQGLEEFKLKPMFREFATLDLPFDVRFSLPRPPVQNQGATRALSSGAKRVFSETLESGRGSGVGEQKIYLPSPLAASSFNFPFAGGPNAWRMKWEPQNQTGFSQFSGPNEVKKNEAVNALPLNIPPPADQKTNPAEPQPSRNQTGTSSEQRAAPVVGWPPVRSFRRNLASQPKIPPAAQPDAPPPPPPPPVVALVEKKPITMFVKVNVEGVPIGRKIDLKAYDSYDKLSVAIDEMFRNSIPAQNPPFSLSGGEYVLVYEDDEGDRMLVGDVPWGMFVTTVKRLRVIRSSEARGLANRDSSLKTNMGTS